MVNILLQWSMSEPPSFGSTSYEVKVFLTTLETRVCEEASRHY
jgi:hypothetical protein